MASRFERLAPLSGLASSVVLVLALVIASGPGYRPTTQVIAEYYARSASQITLGHYLGYISIMLLLWFAGSVYQALHSAESGTGRLAMIAFGGALFTGAAIFAGFSLLDTGADLATSPGGISVETAGIIGEMYTKAMASGWSAGLAVFIGATGVAALRAGGLPTWFGWTSVVMAVLCLTPLHWLTQALSAPWIAFVSVWIFVKMNPALAG